MTKPASEYQAAAAKTVADLQAGKAPDAVAPTPEVAPASVETKPASPATVPAVEGVPAGIESPTLKQSFQKLAEQSKALRERESRVKPLESLGRVVDPVKLERALIARDPLAVLESVGLRYEDVAERIVASQAPKEVPRDPGVEVPAHVKSLEEKVAKLEQTLAAEKASAARSSVAARAAPFLDANKFPLASKLGPDAVNEAIEMLEKYYSENDRFPAESFEENVTLALGLVEERHAQLLKRYGLTPPKMTPSVMGKAEAPAQPRGEVFGQTTLTSALTATGNGSAPKSDADYQAAAIAAVKQLR